MPRLTQAHTFSKVHSLVYFTKMHYLNHYLSSSSSSESELPDYAAILLGSSSDSSASEQPINNVEYSNFAGVLQESRDEDPLTSTQNQEALSNDLSAFLDSINSESSIHLEVSRLDVLSDINPEEVRLSRIIDRPTVQPEPNMRLDLVPRITQDQTEHGNQTFEIFEERHGNTTRTIKYKLMKKGSSQDKDTLIEECDGIQRTLVRKSKEKFDEYPCWLCAKYKARKKEDRCTGSFSPASRLQPTATRKVRQVSRRIPHTCQGSPLEESNRAARRQVRADVDDPQEQ